MMDDYDAIVVGGGLAGATLGRSLAQGGARVLVLEQERVFRDRVRGELVQPWGVVETRALGIYDLIKRTCGYEVRLRLSQIRGQSPAKPRDLIATTPQGAGSLHFPHPDMQSVLLDACLQAGAAVQRGARVCEIATGSRPSVEVRSDEGQRTFTARLIVGADGRTSICRSKAGFTTQSDQNAMVLAGVLLESLSAPEDMVSVFINPADGEVAFLIPLGGKRFRCYSGYYPEDNRRRLSGPDALPAFLSGCIHAGAAGDWFVDAKAAGPLAAFECTETWTTHPYRAGVVLIGDAAAISNPAFGCGLALAMRDVRVLSELLIRESDWERAAQAYAEEHDRYFAKMHRLLGWMTQLFYARGPEAAARRERAFARLASDPSRAPDIAGLGPESPSDEAAYNNLFGEASGA